MNRIISFSEVSDTLEIVPPLGTPSRCAYVKVATENNGTSTPNSPINRLIWRVAKNTTSYTVTWVFNDGVTPDKVETNVPQGTSVNSATAGKPTTDPTRADYDFAGWYIGNDPLNNQTVTGNITVTAHWTPVTPTVYTITFEDWDGTQIGQTIVGASGVLFTTPSVVPTRQGYVFTNYESDHGRILRLGQRLIIQNYSEVFVAQYNQPDPPDPTKVKTMDNFGQIVNTSKSNPTTSIATYKPTGSDSAYWWSGPHDGHARKTIKDANDNPIAVSRGDSFGEDNGIAPGKVPSGGTDSVTGLPILGRSSLTIDGVCYTHYDGDSIMYEYVHVKNSDNFPTSVSAVQTLMDHWDYVDDITGNEFHIDCRAYPWVKFAILDIRQSQYYIEGVLIEAMIEYFIAKNSANSPREGKITVVTSGGPCTYRTIEGGLHPDYVDDGRVYFYQLGANEGYRNSNAINKEGIDFTDPDVL